MKRQALVVLMWCFTLSALTSNVSIPQQRTLPITKETLATYRNDFDDFINNKRKEKDTLASLPSGNTWFGMATNFIIEKLIAPIFNQYGDVNIEEAKIFLGRSFEQEEVLKRAIDNLSLNDDSIAYIDSIFAQAEGDILNKKDGVGFLKIIKKTKYKKVPDPKYMGNKNDQGEYVICVKDFCEYSIATLMAFHIFENHVKITPTSRKKRKHTNNEEEFA